MFNDWKKRVDQWVSTNVSPELPRKSEFECLYEKEQEERRKKIEILARKFHCHVCHIVADSPRVVFDGYEPESPDRTHEDWSQPGNLLQCGTCKNWFCLSHYHNGNCIGCWKKRTGLQLQGANN